MDFIPKQSLSRLRRQLPLHKGALFLSPKIYLLFLGKHCIFGLQMPKHGIPVWYAVLLRLFLRTLQKVAEQIVLEHFDGVAVLAADGLAVHLDHAHTECRC